MVQSLLHVRQVAREALHSNHAARARDGSVEKRGAPQQQRSALWRRWHEEKSDEPPLLFAHLDLDINDSELLHPATDHALTRTHSHTTTAAAAAAAAAAVTNERQQHRLQRHRTDNGNGNGDKNAVASPSGGRNTLDGEPDRSVAAEASGRNYRRGLAMALSPTLQDDIENMEVRVLRRRVAEQEAAITMLEQVGGGRAALDMLFISCVSGSIRFNASIYLINQFTYDCVICFCFRVALCLFSVCFFCRRRASARRTTRRSWRG